MCTGRDRCGTAFHDQTWNKQPLEGLRSSCLGIPWALGLSVEIFASETSSFEAFCVGLPGPSLPRQLVLEA